MVTSFLSNSELDVFGRNRPRLPKNRQNGQKSPNFTRNPKKFSRLNEFLSRLNKLSLDKKSYVIPLHARLNNCRWDLKSRWAASPHHCGCLCWWCMTKMLLFRCAWDFCCVVWLLLLLLLLREPLVGHCNCCCGCCCCVSHLLADVVLLDVDEQLSESIHTEGVIVEHNSVVSSSKSIYSKSQTQSMTEWKFLPHQETFLL